MGETRVDLLHLLEDLRDAYPGYTARGARRVRWRSISQVTALIGLSLG